MSRVVGSSCIALICFALAFLPHGVSSAGPGAPAAPALPAAAAGVSASAAPIADSLVVLSTTDVIGKTSPCGCHTPKGGLARQATFADSMRSRYANVLLVDNGNFFPEDELHRGRRLVPDHAP